MSHPMILSIFVILPCLCDLTQLYKPRAVYHLGWGKWLNTGSQMHAQISGWAPMCWLLHNAVRHGSFPASSIFHPGRQRLGGWRDSPNKGLVAFVPSAKNKIKLKNSFMTHSKENAICLCLGHSVYKRRLVWEVDSLLHNIVCEVSREDWLLETAPLGFS